MQGRTLKIANVEYHFPGSDIVSFVDPGKGRPYARIRPPGQNFDLIYSSRAGSRKNWQSPDVPLVTSLNDHPADGFNERDFSGGKTICRLGQPYFNCGLRITDEGAQWSVVFDEIHVESSDAIRRKAAEVLKQYRS